MPTIELVGDAFGDLADLDISGKPLGYAVKDILTGEQWILSQSTEPVDHVDVEYVFGKPDLRWKRQIISGGGIATLTSDVTASGTGSVPATVVNVNTPVIAAKVVGIGGTIVEERTPQMAPGMVAWWKFDELGLADGTAVSSFADASPFASSLAQTDPTKRPVCKTGANGVNGLSVLHCSNGGGNQLASYLQATITARDWTGFTIYVVSRATTAGGTARTVVSTHTGLWWLFGNDSGGGGAGGGGASGNVDFGTVTGFATGKTQYLRYKTNKTHWSIDGSSIASPADTSFPSTGPKVFWVGSSDYPNTQFNGDVCEVVIYPFEVSAAQDADNKSCLEHKWGIDVTTQATKIYIGSPVTFQAPLRPKRYIDPAGDDENDGLSELTAKRTLLAAWDEAQASVPAGVCVEFHYNDLSYIGGEVASQGFWLWTIADPGLPGWRKFRPYQLIGHGGPSDGLGFGKCKARLLVGQPGDPQGWSTTKPFMWLLDMEVEASMERVRPYEFGQWRLAVPPTSLGTDRSRLISNMYLIDCAGISPKQTAGMTPGVDFGTPWDCGWLNVVRFIRPQAEGASQYVTPVVTNTDHVVASTRTWTIANGNFTADHVGGWLQVIGASVVGNNGIRRIESVTNSTTVVTTLDSSPAIGNETFVPANVTINVSYGPSILDDDNHAGFLFRPTDPDMSGDPGSMGEVYFEEVSLIAAGIKYYIGSTGEIALKIDKLITEHGPQPHPVQVTYIPGQNLGLVATGLDAVKVHDTNIADGERADSHDIWIHPDLHDKFQDGTFVASDLAGTAYGPVLMVDHVDRITDLATTPMAARQYGVYHGGHMVAKTQGGKRTGAPGTALPSSDTNTGVTNLAPHDPTTWTAQSGAVLTAGTLDVFGLNNACDIARDVTESSFLQFVANTATYATGDFVIAGVWCRGVSGKTGSPVGTASPATGVLTSRVGGNVIQLKPIWSGNGNWMFCADAGRYAVGGGSATDTITFTGRSSEYGAQRLAYPVLIHLKNTGGHTWTNEEVQEMVAYAATWNPNLAQGMVGTLRGQSFVADGGFGVPASLFRTVGAGSGQLTLGATYGYVPIMDKDGKTILCWVLGTAATVNP